MPTAPPAPPKPASRVSDAEGLVDARIRKTRAAVKSADIATGVGLLIAWGLVVLLVAAVADHWLVAGGFDRWGRVAVFAVGAIGAGVIVWKRLAPVAMRRVNPLYAAKEIERESPHLKNALLNLLQLRNGGAPAGVRRTLERQAEERLTAAGESPIDHTPVVRVAQLLMALVAVIGVYVVASPKDFFASAGRVLAPWSEIAAPSRVRITDVEPGAATLSQGDRLEVSATVTGLAADEITELVYSTSDGGVVERRLPMHAAGGRVLHDIALPPGASSEAALGLQGDLVYRIEAGDARTRNWRVEVLAAPTIAPVSIAYHYPDYTGLTDRTTEGAGDIRAVEGTRVTLTAEANLPIADAQVDLGADGRPDVTMRVDGRTAVAEWKLRHDERAGPIDSSHYVIRFASTDDQANTDPPRYKIEVIADLPPEVSITAPEGNAVDVAVDGALRVTGEGRDPDFALKSVRLIGEARGRRVLERDLPGGAGPGRRRVETELQPRKVGLAPGDVLEYWFEATDNRTPKGSVTRSELKRVRVVDPAGGERRGDDAAPNGQPGPGQPDAQQDASQDGDPGEGKPSAAGGNQGDQSQQKPNAQQQREQQQGDQQQQQGAEEGSNGKQPPKAEKPDSDSNQPNSAPQPGVRGPGEDDPNAAPQDDATGAQGESESDGEGQSQPSAGGGAQQGADGQQRGPAGQPPGDGDPSQPSGDGSQPSGDGEQPNSDPVARDGSDDGSAFDRIREFLNQKSNDNQPNQQGGQTKNPADRQGQQAARPQQRPGEGAGDPDQAQPSNESQANQEDNARPGSNASQRQHRDGRPGESPDRPQGSPGASPDDRSGEQSESESSESGGDTPPGEQSDSRPSPREGTGGSGQNQAADRGAGQSADQGAGDSTGRPGEQEASDEASGESGGPQTPTGRQSPQGAGREQPGEKGSADQPGESGRDGGDSAQSNGSDQLSQDGNPAGDRAGDAEQASDRQGSNDQRGDSPGKSRPDGNQQGDPSGQPRGDAPDSPDSRPGDNRGEGEPGRADGAQPPPSADGRGLQGAGRGSEVGGDKANLDYARKQTELVLERLEDQLRRKEVDRRLLDELGWTEGDLERFVERWRSRRQRAQSRDPEGKAELDRALRSLGLSREGPTGERERPIDDLRDLSERSRTAPPPGLEDAMRRFQRSVNRVDDND